MILDDCTSTDDFSRLSPVEFPPAKPTNESKCRFKLKSEESHQPAVKPTESSAASDLAGGVRLEMLFHKPVTMEPLSITWEGLSAALSEPPIESQRPPSVKGRGFTELFIEEEEETREDKEEDIKGLNERLSPQVEHGVSCILSLQTLQRPWN